MMDNNYWKFQQGVVDNDQVSMLIPQPQAAAAQQQLNAYETTGTTTQAPSNLATESSDNRQWSQCFNDFDMDSQREQNFHMDDYHNIEHSEADSPDSNHSNGSHRRNDLSESVLGGGGDQKQRRKEQNRAAQKAFRERKERYVKELQLKIKEMEKKHDTELSRVTKENETLKNLVKKMEAEIYSLKGAAMAFGVTISRLREAGLHVAHPISPPTQQSDLQQPVPTSHIHSTTGTTSRSSAIATTQDKDEYSIHHCTVRSIHNPLFDSFHAPQPQHMQQAKNKKQQHARMMFHGHHNEEQEEQEEEEEEEEENFAARETDRFQHAVDPIMHSGVKLIPFSQIWEKLSQHPNFEDFDIDRLCEELKKKAKCSGTGPVIPESDIQEVLHKMDVGIA